MMAAFSGLRIAGVAGALPQRTLSMLELAGQYGKLEVQRIMRSTGIETVHLAGSLTTGDLCAGAALSLFAGLAIDPRSIDAIVLITQTPDQAMPATSATLQRRLGLRSDVIAIDVNAGCSGYIVGLYQASMLLGGGGCRRVLLLTGDVITKLLRPDDRHVRMVFGDGASATLLERGSGAMQFSFHTDGGGAAHIHTPLEYDTGCPHAGRMGHLHMDGAAVMNFALEEVPKAIHAFLDRQQMQVSDVPLFLLHQANTFMLQYLAKRLKVAPSKVPIQLQRMGNTGPSSIPLMLSAGCPGVNFQQENLVACGFGVGLSVGVATLSLASTVLLPPVLLPS